MSGYTPGPWEHGKYGPLSFEEMRQKYAESLKATVDHFGGEFLNDVHGVYVAGTEIRICDTGISPNSPANARLIATAPELLDFAKKARDSVVCVCRINKIVAATGAGIPCTRCEADALIAKAEGK